MQHINTNLWLVMDDLPEYIAPQTLYELYHLLEKYVVPSEQSPLCYMWEETPVIIRFVDANDTLPFPDGTEGCAGLVGLAQWSCMPVYNSQSEDWNFQCLLWAEGQNMSEIAHQIILVLIREQEDPKETLGYAVHEIAHVFGAIDGPLCPAHEDYNPMKPPDTDLSDSYWWFGPTGMWTMQPAGTVWKALNHECETCGRPEICRSLHDILPEMP